MKNASESKKNGLRFRLRVNSCIFLLSVGWACEQSDCVLAHLAHVLEVTLNFCNSSNSDWTAFGETQPRSHCNDSSASAWRFFDSNQSGDSGTYNENGNEWVLFCGSAAAAMQILTKQMATCVITGTIMQINATFRHDIKFASNNIRKTPPVLAKLDSPMSTPRTDGWLQQIQLSNVLLGWICAAMH